MVKINKWLLCMALGLIFFMPLGISSVRADSNPNEAIHLSKNDSRSNEFHQEMDRMGGHRHDHHPFINHQTYTVKPTQLHLVGKDDKKTVNLKAHTQVKIVIPHQGFTLVQVGKQKGYIDNGSLYKNQTVIEFYFHKLKEFLRFKDLVMHNPGYVHH